MDNYLNSLFEQIRLAAHEAMSKGDKYIVIDKIYENRDDLSLFSFQDVLRKILSVIEEYPTLDYGGPGPFGSFIEEHPFSDYAPMLLESLFRQPSTQVVSWLDRSVMDNDFQNGMGTNPVTPTEFASCLMSIIKNPNASVECKEFSEMCLSDLKKRGHVNA
ncbi:MAG: hypothetical protein LBQ20_02495 [Rhodanobacter sp.]|nr:hypothetical protein [Rhodanobacter sp.]